MNHSFFIVRLSFKHDGATASKLQKKITSTYKQKREAHPVARFTD